jgi:hypothetical protein
LSHVEDEIGKHEAEAHYRRGEQMKIGEVYQVSNERETHTITRAKIGLVVRKDSSMPGAMTDVLTLLPQKDVERRTGYSLDDLDLTDYFWDGAPIEEYIVELEEVMPERQTLKSGYRVM